MRVLHVTTGLDRGGAETQLCRLLLASPVAVGVFSLRNPSSLADQLTSVGITVESGGAAGLFSLDWIAALRRAVRTHRPSLVCSWMYHANVGSALFLGGLSVPLIWNIRHSVQDLRREKLSTRWIIRAGGWLSKRPARIVYNSRVAASQHDDLGYCAQSRVVIPNGFDVDHFKPSLPLRTAMRAKLGVSAKERLVGVVGRTHPMKNHRGFVEAACTIFDRYHNVRVVMVGRGVDSAENGLSQMIKSRAAEGRIQLVGEVDKPEKIYPALDVLVMPSLWGEGFPNVVAEAMACGVPCVVTDVGDAAHVVGKTGIVVRSGEPGQLVTGLTQMLQLSTRELRTRGEAARRRISKHFGISSVAQRYASLFDEALCGNEGRYLR